jgi:hypothetical protein
MELSPCAKEASDVRPFGPGLPWGVRAQDYLPRTVSIPERTNSSLERGNLPHAPAGNPCLP